MQTELITKASGLMINSMGTELNLGQMVLDTKVIMKTGRKKDKADLHLPTAATTKDSSKRTRYLASETTTGLMANHMQATGARTKWMAMEFSPGRMERNMRVTL